MFVVVSLKGNLHVYEIKSTKACPTKISFCLPPIANSLRDQDLGFTWVIK